MPTLSGMARIGRDAEVRDANGTSVCNLSLAFSCRVKNERITTWVDGSLWGKQAESLAPYLTKGAVVSVTLNDVHLAAFTKGDGTSATKLAGRVIDIELGPKTDAAPPPPPPPPPPRPAPAKTGYDDMDDGIPF